MMTSKNKRILLGITGGIAAYKTPELVRRLNELGGEVRVVMTQSAKHFVAPLSLQAVSGSPVANDLFDEGVTSGMGHVELGRWADIILIAPGSANFIAKMANGIADDLLSTLILVSEAQIVVAPAMNQQMWQHPATQRNLRRLEDDGVRIIGPDSGEQACGEVGPGRMTEPGEIASTIMMESGFDSWPLCGQRILLTAGPTWEAIDPVRGITNHSSGKMGYALAQAARNLGAEVTLISGPVNLIAPEGVALISVVSAQDMLDAVKKRIGDVDMFIAVAAVADYRPVNIAEQKIKKDNQNMIIEMVKNPDILAWVGALPNRPFTVGFAAETEQVLEHARAKRIRKNADVIAANNVARDDAGFGHDDNSVTLIHDGEDIPLATQDKYALAVEMLHHIATWLPQR